LLKIKFGKGNEHMARLPILIVDDNEFIRASMVKFLENNGYIVVGVGHAQDAMDELRNHEYGLIITDILMPETDGFELIDFIRGYEEPLKSTPIIAITGGGRSLNANASMETLEDKANLVLRKPFNKKILLNNVAELIKKGASDEQINHNADNIIFVE